MKTKAKGAGFSFLMLYLMALVIAGLARIGLVFMGNVALLGFNYKSAAAPAVSDSPILDQLMGALTGGSLIGFMFAAGLVLSLAVVSALLYAHVYTHGGENNSSVGTALLWGALTTIVSIACLVIVIGGLFSTVQLGQMMKMGGGGGMAGIAVLFLLAIGSLIAAASLLVCACTLRSNDARGTAVKMLVTTIVCGLLVCIAVVVTYMPIAQATLDNVAFGARLFMDIVLNGIFIGIALAMMKAEKKPAKDTFANPETDAQPAK